MEPTLTPLQDLGARLKIIRERRHLNHRQLAAKLGMCRQNYSRIEAGIVDMPVSRLLRLAEVLDVPAAMILPPRATHESE